MDQKNKGRHGSFVGNGGQAYEVLGQLIPRDLFEAGVYKNPFFGERNDARIAQKIEALSLENLEIPKTLLSRKITDLNNMMESLGDWVLNAISKYQWQVSDIALARTHEGDSVFTQDPLTPIVQIANRVQNKIFVHRDCWNRLSDEYKAALYIHEGIYSLLKVTEVTDGIFVQHGPTARQLTGLLFQQPVVKQAKEVREKVLAELEIVSDEGKSGDLQFYSYRTGDGFDQYGIRILTSRL